MRLPLTRSENIELTIIIIHPTLSLLYRLLLVRLGGYIANLSDFFTASGVQLAQFDCGFFHYRRAAFSSMLKSRVGNILAKDADLRVTLNLDGTPITSKSHTHLTHTQSSRLLTSSLSLGVPVPRATQCMRGV